MPDGLHIDFLVAAGGFGDISFGLGKRGRIENDQIETFPQIAQIVKDIPLDDRVVFRVAVVEAQMLRGRRAGGLGNVQRNYFFGPAPGGVNGKRAGVAKAVQHRPAPGQGTDSLPVDALVEEKAGFLAVNKIHVEPVAVFRHARGAFLIRSVEKTPSLRQAFQSARAPGALLVDAIRLQVEKQGVQNGLLRRSILAVATDKISVSL